MPQRISRNSGFLATLVLVCVAILLALVAVGFFNNRPSYGVFNHRTIIPKGCGITLYQPKDTTTAIDSITVSGYARGCGWSPALNGDLGMIFVLDAKGKVLAQQKLSVVLEEGDTSTAPYSFDTAIQIPRLTNQKGLLIIENTFTGSARQSVSRTIEFQPLN